VSSRYESMESDLRDFFLWLLARSMLIVGERER